MYLKYFYDNHLAQASYMIGCQKTGEAAIIDPSRMIDSYVQVAEEQGFIIKKVLETHIHADFVSGSTELARRTNATIYHSAEGGDANGGYEFGSSLSTQGVKHEETISVGNVQLKAIFTPGHTPEHMSYELTDRMNAELPMGVFTGDFVFVGDVGRPDLLEKAVGVKDSADKGARQMFNSLQEFKKYEDYIQIWPGHGAGSSCGKSLGAVPTSTVGYEKRYNPAFQPTEEQNFVEFLLDGQPEPPAYFAKMKEVNPSGMTPLSEVSSAVQMGLDGDAVRKLAQSGQALVVDTRSAIAYANGSLPGTLNLPFPGSFAEWMGRLANYEVDLYIIADLQHIDEIENVFAAMGMDRFKGFFSPSVVNPTQELRSYVSKNPKEVDAEIEQNNLQIVDVRYTDEWKESHIPNAINIPLHELDKNTDQLSTDRPVMVHCQTGIRSVIASSILLNHGFDVINVNGGFKEWKEQQLATTSK